MATETGALSGKSRTLISPIEVTITTTGPSVLGGVDVGAVSAERVGGGSPARAVPRPRRPTGRPTVVRRTRRAERPIREVMSPRRNGAKKLFQRMMRHLESDS